MEKATREIIESATGKPVHSEKHAMADGLTLILSTLGAAMAVGALAEWLVYRDINSRPFPYTKRRRRR